MSISLNVKVALAAEAPTNEVGVKYQAHVANYAWMNPVYNGDLGGTTGQWLRMEGVRITLQNPVPGMRIKYRAQGENYGWQNWVYDGVLAGTEGKALRLEGIRIVLEGAPAGYHVQYQAHVAGTGWQNWVQDGELAGTEGQWLRMEALRVRIVKDTSVDSGGIGLKYQAHVANYAWMNPVYNGEVAGTTGQWLRMEGLRISLQNAPAGMKIRYRAQGENYGWQNWVYDGQLAGTEGKALRLEGIRIQLENAPPGYHVQYQAHIEKVGWQNWVQDGELAGTDGKWMRMEAIRIRIVNYLAGVEADQNTPVYNYTNYNITLNDMVNMQMQNSPALQVKNSSNQWEWRYADIRNGQKGYYIYVPKRDSQGNIVKDSAGKTVYEEKWTVSSADYDAIRQELINNIDPSIIVNNDTSIYQFVRLSFIDGVTASQLNAQFRSDGVLAGKGQVFIDAAKKYNINPIYLAGHAILETGNGVSNLATGIIVNGVKVYNLFGINAFDDNAEAYGSQYAYQKGWTSIDAAIYGGAEWIGTGYINNQYYKQDSIYKMKWNPSNPTVHQYATDVRWASNQTIYTKKIFDLFKNTKLVFEIPVYKK
jgi:beta-N-acetylglucosaminidase/uncharacterized protein YjdB